MPQLYNQKTGALIADITADQLQFLVDQLEEEGTTDRDYYIDENTLSVFRDAGGDPALIELLAAAMGDAGEIDIEWK
jgi:hypothetical protein